MKKLAILASGLLLFAPSLVFADAIAVRLGYFMPLASADIGLHPDSLWAIEFDQMSFTRKDYQGGMLGIGYEYFLGKNISLAFTLDSYSKSRLGDYRYYDQTEFTDGWFAFPIDSEPSDITDWYYISHSFKVTSLPLQASIKFTPLGRKTRLIPYVGGGAGLYFWSVRLFGESINFLPEDEAGNPIEYYYDDPELGEIVIFPVEAVNGKEHGVTFGGHAFAGVQFPIGYQVTIEAEARYHWAKARLNEWFVGFEDFDLSGLALTIGVSYWF